MKNILVDKTKQILSKTRSAMRANEGRRSTLFEQGGGGCEAKTLLYDTYFMDITLYARCDAGAACETFYMTS